MKIFTQLDKFYMYAAFSILLLFIAKGTALGLSEEDAKNEVRKTNFLVLYLLRNYLIKIIF